MTEREHQTTTHQELEALDRSLQVRIERFREALTDAAADVVERFEPVAEGVARDAEAVRRLVRTSAGSAGDAWRSISAKADNAYRVMAARIGTELDRLRVEMGRSGQDYREFAEDRLEDLQEVLDRLRVQAQLARMEADDRAGGFIAAAGDAFRGVERAVRLDDERGAGARIAGLLDDFSAAAGKATQALLGREETS